MRHGSTGGELAYEREELWAMGDKVLTVGELRAILAGLPEDTPIYAVPEPGADGGEVVQIVTDKDSHFEHIGDEIVGEWYTDCVLFVVAANNWNEGRET